jgi:hypothetical protein
MRLWGGGGFYTLCWQVLVPLKKHILACETFQDIFVPFTCCYYHYHHDQSGGGPTASLHQESSVGPASTSENRGLGGARMPEAS